MSGVKPVSNQHRHDAKLLRPCESPPNDTDHTGEQNNEVCVLVVNIVCPGRCRCPNVHHVLFKIQHLKPTVVQNRSENSKKRKEKRHFSLNAKTGV